MKNLLLKTILKALGKDIFFKYQELKKMEYNSLKKNLEIQEDKLKKILLHSWEHVPYYKKVLENVSVIRNGKVSLENFNKIPILTKAIIRENFDLLKSDDYKKRKPYLNTSGGSTGEPVRLIQDREYWINNMASAWFFNSFANQFPCRHIKLWGSERDILQGGYGIVGDLKNWVYQRKLLNSFRMSKDDMKNYVEKINSYKPLIIEAYVQSIYELAKFIKENKLKVFSPKGIIVSAGTLYPEMRNLIKDVFNAKVFNRYGSREVGIIACSCKENEGLHLNIFGNYVEILNDKLKPCKPKELGRVYVTTLANYSMPLIRYDIGDIGSFAGEKKCSCGRGLPLLRNVEGREMSVFKTKEGKIIPGEFFIHFIGVVFNKNIISKFQVIQREYNLIEIKVVLRNKKRQEESKLDIERSIKKVMGKGCEVKWNFVKDIEPTKSGKYLYTISKIK